jgi:hypothetical protein
MQEHACSPRFLGRLFRPTDQVLRLSPLVIRVGKRKGTSSNGQSPGTLVEAKQGAAGHQLALHAVWVDLYCPVGNLERGSGSILLEICFSQQAECRRECIVARDNRLQESLRGLDALPSTGLQIGNVNCGKLRRCDEESRNRARAAQLYRPLEARDCIILLLLPQLKESLHLIGRGGTRGRRERPFEKRGRLNRALQLNMQARDQHRRFVRGQLPVCPAIFADRRRDSDALLVELRALTYAENDSWNVFRSPNAFRPAVRLSTPSSMAVR